MMDNARARSLCSIAVCGDGPDADRWWRAFRGVEDTRTVRVAAEQLSDLLSDPGIEAVAFAGPSADPAGSINRAMLAEKDVLIATAPTLSSRQMLSMAEMARARGRVLMFDAGILGDERLAFAKKMTRGSAALWRSRFLRSMRTGSVGSEQTFASIVVSEIARVLTLAGDVPSRVHAVAPTMHDDDATPEIVMMLLTFESGLVAQIDVSIAEAVRREEITIGCDGRTIVLDALDARTPLRIEANTRHRGPQQGTQWAETVIEYPSAEPRDRLHLAATAFRDAVIERNLQANNADEMARAASVWEAARSSLTACGNSDDVVVDAALQKPTRPALHLIRGGGHAEEERHARPELTLVGRR